MQPPLRFSSPRRHPVPCVLSCLHAVLIFGVLTILSGGCAREERRTVTVDRPNQSSLQSLYARLPDSQPRDAALRQPGVGMITPQSELSLAVSQSQALRLRGEFQRLALHWGAPIFIRIFKESRELELWVQRGERFYLFKKYPIAYFSGGLGPKLHEGDLQAPEGFYEVFPSRMNPWSNFHLAFNIGYPNLYDQTQQASGGMIMIHGKQHSSGCFAMTDPVIEEIYTIADQALNTGQPSFQVHIFPFRMTPANLQRHGHSPHIAFWRNMLRGYTLFELTHVPPQVSVEGNRYAFSSSRVRPEAVMRASRANMVSIQREVQILP